MDEYFKIFWLDTSALVKLFINEPGSKELNSEFNGKPGNIFYSTDYCRYELFNVLKRKLVKDKSISHEEYLRHIFIISTYIKMNKIRIDDKDHNTNIIWQETKVFVEKYGIDYTDAIQFTLLKRGFLNIFKGGESEAILITSDQNMIKAAKAEDMRFWNPEKGSLKDK